MCDAGVHDIYAQIREQVALAAWERGTEDEEPEAQEQRQRP